MLTTKQKIFCQEYLKDFNATNAAKRAGYSEATAYSIGSENLSKPEIQKYLNRLKSDLSKRNNITIDDLIGELKSLAFFDIKDFYDEDGNLKPIPELSKEVAKAIASFEVDVRFDKDGNEISRTKKIKTVDKLQSIEKLMRYLGAYERDNKQRGLNIDGIEITIVK